MTNFLYSLASIFQNASNVKIQNGSFTSIVGDMYTITGASDTNNPTSNRQIKELVVAVDYYKEVGFPIRNVDFNAMECFDVVAGYDNNPLLIIYAEHVDLSTETFNVKPHYLLADIVFKSFGMVILGDTHPSMDGDYSYWILVFHGIGMLMFGGRVNYNICHDRMRRLSPYINWNYYHDEMIVENEVSLKGAVGTCHKFTPLGLSIIQSIIYEKVACPAHM
ncbi:hypothetical protein BDQ17DRAFT_1320968 [Cyathus striatus]|nr:hypothetical protein BDQ17DRAFT_1320968 [Cyathus striatus]